MTREIPAGLNEFEQLVILEPAEAVGPTHLIGRSPSWPARGNGLRTPLQAAGWHRFGTVPPKSTGPRLSQGSRRGTGHASYRGLARCPAPAPTREQAGLAYKPSPPRVA